MPHWRSTWRPSGASCASTNKIFVLRRWSFVSRITTCSKWRNLAQYEETDSCVRAISAVAPGRLPARGHAGSHDRSQRICEDRTVCYTFARGIADGHSAALANSFARRRYVATIPNAKANVPSPTHAHPSVAHTHTERQRDDPHHRLRQ